MQAVRLSKELPQMADKLSPIYIAQQLHQHDLFYFTPSLLADLFRLDRCRVYRLIARLKDQALITEVEKGKYLLLGLGPERVLSNPLFIASHLVAPSYVSYWSALHFYGFTEQVPLTTFVATTKKKRPATFRDFRFRFVTVKPRKFFGYRRETLGDLPVIVADEAKAIVDSLDLPDYAGGLGEIAKALCAALETAEVETLVQYANRVGDKSLGSRLGYLLEALGQPAEGLIRSASPVKLDVSGSRIGEIDTRWQVVVNVPERSLAPQGAG
jgi:predicted transcriptional regulator of viral defense system